MPERDDEDIGPDERDYDLSEEHGYMWEPKRESPVPVWLIILITALVIAALVLPAVIVGYRAS